MTTWNPNFDTRTVAVVDWSLVPIGTNLIFAPTGGLVEGQVIDPSDSAIGGWQTNAFDLLSFDPWKSVEGFIGPLALSTNVYLGVRFAAADGLHAGWLQFQSVLPPPPSCCYWVTQAWKVASIASTGFQPGILAPIQVGQVLPANPWTNSVGNPLPLTLSSGGTIDALVSVVSSTNAVSGALLTTTTITGSPGFEFLARTGSVDSVSVFLPVPFPERLMVPTNVSATVGAWLSATNALVLLEETRSSSSSGVQQAGPLSTNKPLFMAFRRSDTSSIGWIRIDGPPLGVIADWSDGDYPAFGEKLKGSPAIVSRIDLDGDGLVDYDLRQTTWKCGGTVWWPCHGTLLRTILYLAPLGTNTILLRPPTPPSDQWPDPSVATIGPRTVLSDTPSSDGQGIIPAWRNGPGYFSFTSTGPCPFCDPPPAATTNGLVGIRFYSSDGVHFGWLWFGSDQPPYFLRSSYEKTPAQPLTFPGRIAARRTPENRLELSWSMQVTGLIVEGSPSLTPPAWITVYSVVGDEQSFVTPFSSNRYFRLRLPAF